MNPCTRLSTLWERARFKFQPTLAELVLALSTLPGRTCLWRTNGLSVLVDNTVLAHAVTHETTWISTGNTRWGPHDIEAGYAARIPVRHKDKNSRAYGSIRYLAGIASLARNHRLWLHSSEELFVERIRQPAGRFSGYRSFDFHLFDGVHLSSLDDSAGMIYGVESPERASVEQQQRANLERSGDELYRGLVKLLGQSNSQDAWHIRTAEVSGMFCFLTMDFALLKAVHARRKEEPIRSLRTRVMTPEELGRHLYLVPLDPALLTYTGASFPVRSDLHWLDDQRHAPPRRTRAPGK